MTSCKSNNSLVEILKRNELGFANGNITLVLHPEDIQQLQNFVTQSNSVTGITLYNFESLERVLSSVQCLQIFSPRRLLEMVSPRIIHISSFSHLKHLHLIRTSPHILADISCIRSQLKSVTCYQSITHLEDLLRKSDDTFGMSSIWSELKFLNISFNELQELDHTLDLLPNLEHLDVSHNELTSSGIQSLKKLKLINLNYNKLREFPSFCYPLYSCLQHLLLKYNYLVDLQGLQYLKLLETLDVSHNILTNHAILEPIGELENLSVLILSGNPLAFHPNHRVLTIQYINRIPKQRGLKLDEKRVTRKEIESAREAHQSTLPCSFASLPHPSINSVFADVHCSVNADSESDSMSSAPLSGSPRVADKTRNEASKKNSKRTREAVIFDVNHENLHGNLPQATEVENRSLSHIETKRLLEERRQELGSGWLISAASILGNNGAPVKDFPSSSRLSQHSETESLNRQSNQIVEAEVIIESQYATQPKVILSNEAADEKPLPSSATESERGDTHIDDETNWFDCPFTKLTQGNSIVLSEESAVKNKEVLHVESDIEDDSEASIFIVQLDGSEDNIFLSVGSEFIIERDSFSARPLQRQSIINLTAIEIITKDDIHIVKLEFEASPKGKLEKQSYKMESLKAAENLKSILSPYIDVKILKTVEDGALQCMKCSSEFSKDVAKRTVITSSKKVIWQKTGLLEETDMCPNCGSTMLIEAQTSKYNKPNEIDNLESKLSSSVTSATRIEDFFRSAGGSTKSIEDSSSLGRSPKTRPRSVSSEVQLQRKAASLSPAGDKDLSDSSSSSIDCISLGQEAPQIATYPAVVSNLSLAQKSESEVTILSNPSQSSIAVISSVVSDHGVAAPLGVIMEHEQMCHVHSFNMYEVPQDKGNAALNEATRVSSPSSETTQWYDSRSGNTLQASAENSPITQQLSTLSVAKSDDEEEIVVEVYNNQLWTQLEEPKEISTDDLTQVDHRVHLYLDVEVFKENEELLAIVKGSAVSFPCESEFPAVLVISSQNVYIFNTTKGTEEDIASYLQEHSTFPLKALTEICTIMGSQGFFMLFGEDIQLILLRDADLCNSLVAHLKELYGERVQFSICTEQNLKSLKQEAFVNEASELIQVKHFLLTYWREGGIPVNSKSVELEPVALIVTSDSLYVTKVHYKVQRKSFEMHFTQMKKQLISSLTMLHITADMESCSLHFFDEDNNTESYWIVRASSRLALSSLLTLLRPTWESIFGIEFQLSFIDNCLCGLDLHSIINFK